MTSLREQDSRIEGEVPGMAVDPGREGVIQVDGLTKCFRVPAETGAAGLVKRVFRCFVREWSEVKALDNVSFTIERGDAVALLGPNGAGKTTTVKILTGILTPTSGAVSVLGFVPHLQRYKYTKHIGLVMGQKSLLIWDIPVVESLRLYKDIYGLEENAFQKRLEEFSDILGIREIMSIPVRKLSLGQRMRAEIASSLLHRPQIIFLDEPTIGLDLIARRQMLEFIKRINREDGVTVVLTTHNMGDVENVCRKAILIDKGSIKYRGTLQDLAQYAPILIVDFRCDDALVQRRASGKTAEYHWQANGDDKYSITVPKEKAAESVKMLLNTSGVQDVSVRQPDLENVVADLYEKGYRLSK